MSDDGDLFDESTLARLQVRMQQIAPQKKIAARSEENFEREAANLERLVREGTLPAHMAEEMLDFINSTYADPSEPTRLEFDLSAFVDHLKTRQATRIPDFKWLYRRRQELDQSAGFE